MSRPVWRACVQNMLKEMLAHLLLAHTSVFAVATLTHDVNTTARDTALLRCSIPAKNIALENLRLYWQDDQTGVLYSYNNGEVMMAHVSDHYLNRVTAFPEEMVRGNISVSIKNPTLEEDGRTFKAFAAILNTLEHTQFCQINLNVGVPYENLELAVDAHTGSALCRVYGGFPAPVIQWAFLYNSSQHLVDSREANTATEQDPETHLYSSSSTLRIPEGHYQAVTCLGYNPTLNRTLRSTLTLNKGAVVGLPGWAAGLIAASAVLLTANS